MYLLLTASTVRTAFCCEVLKSANVSSVNFFYVSCCKVLKSANVSSVNLCFPFALPKMQETILMFLVARF